MKKLSAVVAAVALCLALAASPVVIVLLAGGGRTERFAVSGALIGFALASIIGSYPTPLIGYGASAILGFALALGLFTKAPR